MIAYIDRELESKLIHNTKEWSTPEEIIEVLKECSIYHKVNTDIEDYTTITILPQKITLDEYKMQEVFNEIDRVFYVKIAYSNPGHEDFCIVVYPKFEEDEEDSYD